VIDPESNKNKKMEISLLASFPKMCKEAIMGWDPVLSQIHDFP